MYQQRVREVYDRLSPGYRRIADYLLEHYRDAAFMTASELGHAVNVDTTSVVRFAQRLGYPGFPELLDEIQAEVKRDLSRLYDAEDGASDALGNFQRSLIADRNNLDHILRRNDSGEITAIARLVRAAHRILIAGEAAAAGIADFMALRLASLGLYAWSISPDILARIGMTVQLAAGDVAIGIAPTAAAAGIAALLSVAHDAGAETVALAGSPTNRAALVADHTLYAPTKSAGPFYSPVALAALAHALTQAVAQDREGQAADWMLRNDRQYRLYMQHMRSQPPITWHQIVAESQNLDDEAAPDAEGGEDNGQEPEAG